MCYTHRPIKPRPNTVVKKSPTNQTKYITPPQQQELPMKYEPQYNSKGQQMGKFLGKELRAGVSHFTIAGKRILVKGTGVKYYETNGDPDTNYIAFRFLDKREDGRWRQLEPTMIVTEAAFTRKAGLWEEPVVERFVTIGQLMEKNGAPCLAGCRALYDYLHGFETNHFQWERDKLIVEITKHSMRNGSWDAAIPVQKLYDWYKKNMGAVPFDYLNYIAQTIGVQWVGAPSSGTGGFKPGSKSYDMICRALGIKP